MRDSHLNQDPMSPAYTLVSVLGSGSIENHYENGKNNGLPLFGKSRLLERVRSASRETLGQMPIVKVRTSNFGQA